MYNEDNILIGQKAKDETQDFINEHFENPDQGWPTFRLDSNDCNEQYYEKYYRALQSS